MKEFFTSLNEHLAVAMGIASALLFFIPHVRTAARKSLSVIGAYAKGPLLLRSMSDQFERFNVRLESIEHEMKHNDGGSIKDHTHRMEARHRADFWSRGRPAMEMLQDGDVNLVSEALCKLCGVYNPESFYGRNWLQFIDGSQVDTVLEILRDMAKSGSMVRFIVTIYGTDKGSRGEWQYNATVVDPPVAGRKLYSGHWSPVDQRAKDLAGLNSWAV